MTSLRKGTVAAAVGIAALLIAGLGYALVQSQQSGRASLRREFARRAAIAARLTSGALVPSDRAQTARKTFGGPERGLKKAVADYNLGVPDAREILLAADGRVLVAVPASLAHDPKLFVRHPDIRQALAGRFMISDLFPGPHGTRLIEIATPFNTRYGRRVSVDSGDVSQIEGFARGYLTSAPAVRHAQAYLLDGHGKVLAASTHARAGRPLPDRALAAALRRAPSGELGGSTITSAPVPGSRWRIVFTAPTAELLAAVDGSHDAEWGLFAAFATAILGLLGIGAAALRNSSRLAASRERERSASQLAHERLHDALTGLPNRALFLDRAQHALDTPRRGADTLAVMFIDIDRFKRINDSLGHAAGDELLSALAGRLRDTLRPVDTVSRFGGDEFLILCTELADEPAALRIAARLQGALTQPFMVAGREVSVTCCIGIAVQGPDDVPTDAAALVRDADAAMYRAKDRGRSRVDLFNADLHREALRRLDTEIALRTALLDDELRVQYQPIVTLPSGAMGGVEALVRWERPGHGVVAPGEFIGLAEDSGLIGPIGAWVLRTAAAEAAAWAEAGLVDDSFMLSVNVSARQLADPLLPETVAGVVDGWELPASALCLEITESAVMEDPDAALAMLLELNALGVRLAVDDFGVGHSSLGQVARSLPIDVIKLDRSFVARMDDPRDRAIVSAVATMAADLEIVAIAEGVESSAQTRQLAAMGYPMAQGFHFARPAQADAIAAALRAQARGRATAPGPYASA